MPGTQGMCSVEYYYTSSALEENPLLTKESRKSISILSPLTLRGGKSELTFIKNLLGAKHALFTYFNNNSSILKLFSRRPNQCLKRLIQVHLVMELGFTMRSFFLQVQALLNPLLN